MEENKMLVVKGKYAQAKIFTRNIESESIDLIKKNLNHPSFSNCRIRVMPDVHLGKDCVIGFTSTLSLGVNPNIIGVDIGCGVLTTILPKEIIVGDLNIVDFDEHVKKIIPSGTSVRENLKLIPNNPKLFIALKDVCDRLNIDYDYVTRGLGTLGGGNHFIELGEDEENYYLTIHSGSRYLGKSICDYYSKLAKEVSNSVMESIDVGYIKNSNDRGSKIFETMSDTVLYENRDTLYEEDMGKYLLDMKLAKYYAYFNRIIMTNLVLDYFDFDKDKINKIRVIESVHNYIDAENEVIRKGAISARLDENLVIPLNMEDGIIIGKGKGLEDWNYSAPHGAGRLTSRNKIKAKLKGKEDEILNRMSSNGIYSTTVTASTSDEFKEAYKKLDLDSLENVEIIKIVKPIYVFKG